jgi:hypothetical protein
MSNFIVESSGAVLRPTNTLLASIRDEHERNLQKTPTQRLSEIARLRALLSEDEDNADG